MAAPTWNKQTHNFAWEVTGQTPTYYGLGSTQHWSLKYNKYIGNDLNKNFGVRDGYKYFTDDKGVMKRLAVGGLGSIPKGSSLGAGVGKILQNASKPTPASATPASATPAPTTPTTPTTPVAKPRTLAPKRDFQAFVGSADEGYTGNNVKIGDAYYDVTSADGARAAQQALIDLGYGADADFGKYGNQGIDGKWGNASNGAYQQYLANMKAAQPGIQEQLDIINNTQEALAQEGKEAPIQNWDDKYQQNYETMQRIFQNNLSKNGGRKWGRQVRKDMLAAGIWDWYRQNQGFGDNMSDKDVTHFMRNQVNPNFTRGVRRYWDTSARNQNVMFGGQLNAGERGYAGGTAYDWQADNDNIIAGVGTDVNNYNEALQNAQSQLATLQQNAGRYGYTPKIPMNKQGGNMKKVYFRAGGQINKFQAGGQAGDPMLQVMQAVKLAVLEIQSGKPGQGCQMVAQIPDEMVAQIKQASPEVGDVILKIKQAMGGQSAMAKRGAKLSYLHTLRTGCPEGQQPYYYKEGGHMCKKCLFKHEIEEMKCGSKVKKNCGGGKTKKRYFGGNI